MAIQEDKFSIRKRIKSFQYAFDGVKYLLKNEHNSRIHLFATIVVVIFAYWMDVSSSEWLALLICIGIVWITEIINSALEKMCDLYSTEYKPNIKVIKDLGAAAVLVASIIAVLISLIIFIPKILNLFT